MKTIYGLWQTDDIEGGDIKAVSYSKELLIERAQEIYGRELEVSGNYLYANTYYVPFQIIEIEVLELNA